MRFLFPIPMIHSGQIMESIHSVTNYLVANYQTYTNSKFIELAIKLILMKFLNFIISAN